MFGELKASHDAASGHACDGGYYLVGLARALPVLFDIDPELWGAPNVLKASPARLRAAGISLSEIDCNGLDQIRAVLADERVVGGRLSRRFVERGTWLMIAFMQYLKALYFLGVDPEAIRRRYVAGPPSVVSYRRRRSSWQHT